jgi:hypothetical protein
MLPDSRWPPRVVASLSQALRLLQAALTWYLGLPSDGFIEFVESIETGHTIEFIEFIGFVEFVEFIEAGD